VYYVYDEMLNGFGNKLKTLGESLFIDLEVLERQFPEVPNWQ